MPVEGVGRTEQDDLGRVPGRGEMHRRGIDRDEQSRLADQGGEGEQIGFSGEIDRTSSGWRFDRGDLRLFHRRAAAGEDAGHAAFLRAVIDHFRPAVRLPEFLARAEPG